MRGIEYHGHSRRHEVIFLDVFEQFFKRHGFLRNGLAILSYSSLKIPSS